MANIQYIGARYVPKFYENSLDPTSCEWESNVNYEGLTVVTYNQDSYTARKPVPNTVGDPASNPDYWALTGPFNAALNALNTAIGALNVIVGNNLPLITTASDCTGAINEIKQLLNDKYFDYMNWFVYYYGRITVTADGVKSYSELFDELKLAFNSATTNVGSKIEVVGLSVAFGALRPEVPYLIKVSDYPVMSFNTYELRGDLPVFETFRIRLSDSGSDILHGVLNANTQNFNYDSTYAATVPPSGEQMHIYYRQWGDS